MCFHQGRVLTIWVLALVLQKVLAWGLQVDPTGQEDLRGDPVDDQSILAVLPARLNVELVWRGPPVRTAQSQLPECTASPPHSTQTNKQLWPSGDRLSDPRHTSTGNVRANRTGAHRCTYRHKAS